MYLITFKLASNQLQTCLIRMLYMRNWFGGRFEVRFDGGLKYDMYGLSIQLCFVQSEPRPRYVCARYKYENSIFIVSNCNGHIFCWS